MILKVTSVLWVSDPEDPLWVAGAQREAEELLGKGPRG